MSLEANKFLGALFGCLLMVLVFNFTAGFLFAATPPAVAGYNLPTAAGAPTAEDNKAAAAVPLPVLLASADAEKGKSVAKQCVSCHTLEKGGKNGTGPNLWNIVGRAVASHEGFSYSEVVKSKGGNWTYEDIDHMVNAPGKFLKGTKMAFAGIKSAKDRADLLAYLRTLSDAPVPLPAADAAK